MVTLSLDTGQLVEWHAQYPVVLIALIRYLPEIRPEHSSRTGSEKKQV